MKRFGSFAAAVALACFTAACSQTDAGVTTKVKAQLAADDLVKAHEVNVDTHEHVVTLSGDVDSEAVRQQAVRIARGTEGVTGVVDELRVVGTTGSIDSQDPKIEIRGSDDKVEIKTDDDLADDIKDGAKATGNAIKKGAEATADGAKKVGEKVRDAVTDDDKDSDNDGR
jgi:hypothetical protein